MAQGNGDPVLAQIKDYYREIENTDARKNQLIEHLITIYGNLRQENEKEALDHEIAKELNREKQKKEAIFGKQILELQEQMRDLKDAVNRKTFVHVLIDGDGMIFDDTLIAQGEAGGKEAASRLWTAVRDYVRQNAYLKDLPQDYKVVTRIYANQKGLGYVCFNNNVTSSPQAIDDFARGFTGNKQLFDFVDVGSGKDRADDKISELFRMNLDNVHCRHILLGCSHDNGYARLLEEISEHEHGHQITLLEGTPFERELVPHGARFATHRFEGLFRTAKFPTTNPYQQPYTGANNHSITPHNTQGGNGIVHEELPANGASTASSSTGQASPYQEVLRPITIPSTSPVPLNWAAMTTAPAPMQSVSSAVAAAPVVPRNRYGQRIDDIKRYDTADFKRIQKIKMCNVHFLRKDCPYGDDCTHDHVYKPTKADLDVLRMIARSTPCKYGTGCDDPKCIYGHRCPHSIEGNTKCRFGSQCRFEEDMHGMEMKVVRTTKIS